MKKIAILLTILALLSACGNKKDKASSIVPLSISVDKGQTAVFYFHSNHRCATCMAVENTAKEALKETFNETVPFYSIDITTDEAKELMKEYKVSVQTLLIVKDDQRKDITSNAFMYARSNPEKVKEEIKTIIESL